MRCNLIKPLAKNWVAWLLLWVGFATSGMLSYLTARHLQSERYLVFQRNVDDTATAIEARLLAYTEVLHGVRGLFAGSVSVSAVEFDRYVASLDLATRYPGVQAISFYPRVPRARKGDFELAARALGGEYAGFSIETRGDLDEHYPIFFRARFIHDSPLLLGSDQMVEPSRRAGIEEARDSGVLTATAPLENWNGKPSEIGVVMRLPLYRAGAPIATLAERRAAATGVVGAAFNVRELIESVTRSRTDGQLSLRIYDAGSAAGSGATRRAQKLLYAEGAPAPYRQAAGLLAWVPDLNQEAVREIDVGGRRWRVSFLPGAERQPFTGFNTLPALVLAGGAVASMLLFALIRSLAQSGQRAQRLAESMVRKLTASERRIAETEKFSSVMVVHSDLEGRMLKVPPTFCHMLGYAPDELQNRLFHEVTHPDDVKMNERAHALLVSGESRTMEIEKRYLRNDGVVVWAALSLTVVVDDDGGPLHFLAYVRDITGQKRAEAELQRLYSELEQRVETRTADLQAANRELEAFSYSVSHDLRAPVRHIAGYLRMLQQQAASRLTDADRRYLGKVGDAASRMGRLIDDLLAFSRTSRTALRLEAVDMNAAARRALDDLAPETAKREVEIVTAALPPARADSALLHLVWVNLLSNAVKYTTPQAGARIEIGTLAGQGDENVYFVRDNGVGFDMEHGHKLFGVFQRLHTQAEFEGTGIGLAIVQRVVSRHGGRVWAEGRPGAGATFCFALPRPAGTAATE